MDLSFCEWPRPVLVILGCSKGNLRDLYEMIVGPEGFRLLGQVDVCAINRAAHLMPCQIIYSYHPELLVSLSVTGLFGPPHLASCNQYQGVAHYPLPQAKLKGSSAIQAAWLALEQWGYRAVIFAGVALGDRDCFGGTADYSFFREHWSGLVAAHGDRCRAMSGYTRELFGLPDAKWITSMTREDRHA